MAIQNGSVVEHATDRGRGRGAVKYVETTAGVTKAGVKWASATGAEEHPISELVEIIPLYDRIADVGPATLKPFQLKVLGRWFEERQALTGELSNQPFQMLPHQVIVTNRVVNSGSDKRSWLIADDVGLGKTIEAGMIMEVLRKKTIGRFRCLIVTPAGLQDQWKQEMETRFRRAFRRFDSRVPGDLEDVDQLIASIDTLKLKKYRDALATTTAWDLVVFDEAHHLATTTDVQTLQLAMYLREKNKARNLVFLTATPHSGNNEHFFNMLRVLREDLFPKGQKDYSNVSLKDVMIRNRKSDVTNAKNEKIFNGIAPAKIIPFQPTKEEVAFFEALRDYLKTGYNVADRLQKSKDNRSKGTAVGFLMSTFGKMASSSRAAILSSLENRRQALLDESDVTEETEAIDERFLGERAEAEVKRAGIEMRAVRGKKKRESLIEGEVRQVEGLIEHGKTLKSPDSKLTAFIDEVKKLPADVKLLIFTEYRPTQTELVKALKVQFGPDSVCTIHGTMAMPHRKEQVDAFNEQRPNPRFMVSTEAGGEGLNMQKSCHTIVNYDLPWNPMDLQQRIGRVYRYGQRHPVVVLNLKVDSTSDAYADHRVYSYLEKKIEEITKKLAEVQNGNPEDIRGEVLGQVAAQISFDDLYKTAVEEGHAKVKQNIDVTAGHIEEIMKNPSMLGLFKGLQRFDLNDYEKVAAKVRVEHLDFFVRQYLAKDGVTVKTPAPGLLSFPVPPAVREIAGKTADADKYQYREAAPEKVERGTVDKEVAQNTLKCQLLRFGDPTFEAMVRHVQHAGYGESVACCRMPASTTGMPAGDEGSWLLFELRVLGRDSGQARVLRNEFVSYVVPRGGEPALVQDVVEGLHEATDGDATIDRAEAKRAYELARARASARLKELTDEATKEFNSDTAKNEILPQEVQDIALAWVQAV